MTEAKHGGPVDALLDDVESAYHEAGHAVAMWKLGFGISKVTIEPEGGLRGYADTARDLVPTPDAPIYARREIIEQHALYLHAGDVATRLLRPDVGLAQAGYDHRRLHGLMNEVEDDGDVQLAWCGYLWQRTFTFIAWQGQWYLIVGLAQQLLEHRTLNGEETERYLRIAAEKLKYDPWMPNAVLVGEVRNVTSPFHREWQRKAWETPLPKRRTEMPPTLVGLSARADTRKLGDVLDISTRAYRRLYWADILTVADLQDWSPHALGYIHRLGDKLRAEIVQAAGRAGIVLPSNDMPLPWKLNPDRWDAHRERNAQRIRELRARARQQRERA
jgi:hypothetical protein